MSLAMPAQLAEFNDSVITEAQLNDIYLSLTSLIRSDISCYLLLDLSLRDINTLAQSYTFYAYIKNRPQNQFRFPLIHEFLDPTISPCLFRLDLSDAHALAFLKQSIYLSFEEKQISNLQLGEGRAICGWLLSTLPAVYIARHLAQTCIQTYQQAQFLFRFYDPAVLPACVTLFSAIAQQRIFSAVSDWLLLDGDGQLNSYHFSERKMAYSGSFGLAENDFLVLQNISIENSVLLYYRSMLQNQPRHGEMEARAIIRAALGNAAHYNIKLEDDLVLFSYYALTVHPMFYQHPVVERQLFMHQKDSYKERIVELQEQDWLRIKQDLELGVDHGM